MLTIFSYILGGVLIAHAQVLPTIQLSQPEIEILPLSTSTIALIVKQAENEFGLDDTFYKTLACESKNFTALGQSEVPNKSGPNGREDSWGIAQISQVWHPEVSLDNSLNVRWAIEWAAKMFASGQAHQWTCWRKIVADST